MSFVSTDTHLRTIALGLHKANSSIYVFVSLPLPTAWTMQSTQSINSLKAKRSQISLNTGTHGS